MSTWFGGIRRAAMLALAWGVAWAPLGLLTGMIVDADGAMDEPWIAIGAYPGFLCALIFSTALAFAHRGSRLAELSFARAAAWGAVSGLLLMVVVTGLLGSPNSEHVLWKGRFVIAGAITLLSALSAVASVWVAGKVKGPVLRDGGVPAA